MRENGEEQVHEAYPCPCETVIGDQIASKIEKAGYFPSNPTKPVAIVSSPSLPATFRTRSDADEKTM